MKVTYNKNKKIFPYIAYIPENISKNPAMIIHLHGAGERGDGKTELDKVLTHGFPNIVDDYNLKDAILIMPQCPKETFWAARVESLKLFIDEMIEKYSVDTNRIYICGLSMGGFGTWYTAMAYPDMFAAIAPCCGGGMAWNAKVLKMPIWAFHGMKDTVVSPSQTIEMVNALKEFNQNLKVSLYEDLGHNSWSKAFSPELLKWMLNNKKNSL